MYLQMEKVLERMKTQYFPRPTPSESILRLLNQTLNIVLVYLGTIYIKSKIF